MSRPLRDLWPSQPGPRRSMKPAAWRLALVLLLLTAYAGWAMELHTLPPWQGPDEPRHFEMVVLTSPFGPKPTLADLDTAFQRALIRSMQETHFARYGWLDPNRPVDLDKATALDDLWPAPAHMFQQPSFYYRLAAAWRGIGPRDLLPALYWLRIFSLFLGVLSLLAVVAVVRKLFPGQPALAFLVAAFVGWHPMLGQMFAVVNNDALVILWATLAYGGMALLVAGKWRATPSAVARRAARRERQLGRLTLSTLKVGRALFGWRAAVWLFVLMLVAWGHRLAAIVRTLMHLLPVRLFLIAILVVLAVWSKRTGLATVPPFFLLLVWLAGRHMSRRQRIRWAASMLLAMALGFLAGAYYWQRLNPYLQLSPHTAELWRQGAYWQALRRIPYLYYARMLWVSYWGDFGWLYAPLPALFYWLWGGWFGLALVGGIRVSRQRRVVEKRLWWGSFIALVSGVLLVYTKEWLFLSYRVGVVPQGRYLFPEILPMTLLVTLGLHSWRDRLSLWRDMMDYLWTSWLLVFAFFVIWCMIRKAFPGS